MKPFIRGSVLCALTLLLLPLEAGAALTIDTVEAGRSFQVMTRNAIALDSADSPHIASGGSRICHDHRGEGSSQVETLDPAPGPR